ncbi:MAG: hypothetical protein ABR874_15035 [Candidatus Sulfotelmatobacter sp.]|jgi:hypothetical protein
MATVKCFHRSSISTIYACLLCMILVGASPRVANALQRKQGRALETQEFFCLTGYDPQDCGRRIAQLKALLIQYPEGAPKHWSWVIVSSEDWQPLLQRLHLDRESPAFSALGERETFLEDALFLPQSKRTEELVERFHTPFGQLLPFAVSHELAHAICQGGSEAMANRVAQQLRGGKYPECVPDVKSLTPIEELYLHSQLPASRHF